MPTSRLFERVYGDDAIHIRHGHIAEAPDAPPRSIWPRAFLGFVIVILGVWIFTIAAFAETRTIYTERCDAAWGVSPGVFQPERREAIYLVHAATGDPFRFESTDPLQRDPFRNLDIRDPLGFLRDRPDLEKFYVWPGWIAVPNSEHDVQSLCRQPATRVQIRGVRWMKGVPGYRRVISRVY